MTLFAAKARFERVNVEQLDAWIGSRPKDHPWLAAVIDARARAEDDSSCLLELRVVFGYARLHERLSTRLEFMPSGAAREKLLDRWIDLKNAMDRNPINWQYADGYLEMVIDAVESADMADKDRPALEHIAKLGLSQKRPRGSRMPALEIWLADADLRKSAKELWRTLERDPPMQLSIDDDKLTDYSHNAKGHSIKFGAFADRLSEAAKNRR